MIACGCGRESRIAVQFAREDVPDLLLCPACARPWLTPAEQVASDLLVTMGGPEVVGSLADAS